MHLALAFVVTGAWRESKPDVRERNQAVASRESEPAREVTMVFLPPPSPDAEQVPAPKPEPKRMSAAVPTQAPEDVFSPGPDEGVEPERADASGDRAEPETAPRPEGSEQPGGRPPQGLGPALKSWEADDHPTTCISPPRPREPGGAIEMGVVVGRVFAADNRTPLAGAHLQILGTPYVGFTDDSGYYRLVFDASLVDNCRTQYVQVSAKGFEGRLLVLALGNRQSDDVWLRRQ